MNESTANTHKGRMSELHFMKKGGFEQQVKNELQLLWMLP
jgi:hypothetical protein